MLHVRHAELGYGQLAIGHVQRALQVVRNDLIVTSTGFLGPILAEVDGLTVDPDSRLPGCLVQTVLRLSLPRVCAAHKMGSETGSKPFHAALPSTTGFRKPRNGKDLNKCSDKDSNLGPTD